MIPKVAFFSVLFSRKIKILVASVLFCISTYAYTNTPFPERTESGNLEKETMLLLSRLEPGVAGMEKVFQNKNYPEKAAEELLIYFRDRKTVRHLVERFSAEDSTRNYATKNDFSIANDALKLLLWKPEEKLDVLVVENQSYENLAHRRSVFFIDKKYFVIVDQAFGDAAGDVNIHFQLAPGKEEAIYDHVNNSVHSNFSEGWNVWVESMPQPGMELKEELGQVSFEYTKKEPRPAFSYGIKKKQEDTEARFVTVVAPYLEKAPQVQVKVINGNSSNRNELYLEIIENGETKKIGYNL